MISLICYITSCIRIIVSIPYHIVDCYINTIDDMQNEKISSIIAKILNIISILRYSSKKLSTHYWNTKF